MVSEHKDAWSLTKLYNIWNNLAEVTILHSQLSSSVGAEPDRHTVAPVQPLLH